MTHIKEKGQEFNILKALCILGLPFIHFPEVLENTFNIMPPSEEGSIIYSLTALGPAVFMICMGYAMGGKQKASRILQTGIQFFLIQLILNICRYVIPYSYKIYTGEFTPEFVISCCVQSDIYMFVALFFITYGIFKKFKLKNSTIFIVSIIAFLINDILTNATLLESSVWTDALGNFIFITETESFPLMTWLVFPMIGIIIKEATKDKDYKEHNSFMLKLLIFSIVVFVITALFMTYLDVDMVYDTYINFGESLIIAYDGILIIVFTALIALGVVNLVYRFIKENILEKFLIKFSAVIMPFYMIHWIFVTWTALFISIIFPDIIIEINFVLIGSLVIMIISCIIAIKFGFSIMRFLLKITDYTKITRKLVK